MREAADDFDACAPLEALDMGNPELIALWLCKRFGDEPAELMSVLFLDIRNRLIGYSVSYRGAISGLTCEPRGILVPALLMNAAGIVVHHNHPSGDPSPSAEDLAFTRRLDEAGAVVGVWLLDHIITGDGGRWVSLRRRGGW
ncbi:MAG TPA: JAB domain-containing protein [Myxococcales bacterium]|nr:JAB domain-containing protein [Myxococcales bacterium]